MQIETGVTPLLQNELIVPDSVQALASITLFWQPQMDANYKCPSQEQIKSEERARKVQAKATRGIKWKLSHKILDLLKIPKTKENIVRVYKEVTNKHI